jgi:hypothetical protein
MRRRLDALAEVHDLGALFPFLRPQRADALAFADRIADSLADGEAVTTELAEQGLDLLDESERRRLVTSYATAYPGPWASVCEDVGDAAVAERALVIGAVKAAIGERRLPPRGVLEDVEAAEEELDTPEKTLLFILPPASVWSIRDVVGASEAAQGIEEFGDWIGAIDAVAEERLSDEHAKRIRQLARHIARRLPLDGLPRTSALLTRACEEVEGDEDGCYELAMHLLTNYVVHLGAELDSVVAAH